MVVIRLARVGRTKYPLYRIVAADKKRAVTSKFLDILGTYDPHTKKIIFDKEQIEKYIRNGAQPSDRVLRLLKSQNIELPIWAKIHDRFKEPKPKKGEEEKSPAEPIIVENSKIQERAAEVAEETADQVEDKKASIDSPETVQAEAKIAQDEKKATENEAKAVETIEDKT